MSASSLAGLSAEIAGLAGTVAPSIAAIEEHGRTVSGFYWRPDVIVTASDRLEAKAGQTVAVHGHESGAADGVVIGHDPTTDVALIRVAKAGSAMKPRVGGPLALGEAVAAAGRTVHGPTCAFGFVALAGGPWRSMRGGDLSARVWLDLRLMRPSEGGAVVDSAGQVAGMAVFGPRRRTLLIPIDTVERAGSELLAHGRIRRGYLGVSLQQVRLPEAASREPQSGRSGMMIVSLDPAAPAARAGLHQGDIILSIGGHTLRSPREVSVLLPAASIGQHVTVDLMRAGVVTKIDVIAGEAPAR